MPALERMLQLYEQGGRAKDRQEASALAAQMIDYWRTEGGYANEESALSNGTLMLDCLPGWATQVSWTASSGESSPMAFMV